MVVIAPDNGGVLSGLAARLSKPATYWSGNWGRKFTLEIMWGWEKITRYMPRLMELLRLKEQGDCVKK